MAAPTFVQAGTGQAVLTIGVTVDIPTAGTVAGDILILQAGKSGTGAQPTLTSITNIESLSGTDNSMTVITASEQPTGGASDGEHNLWIGRIIATNTATSLVFNTPAADNYVRLYQFTGVNAGTTLNDVVENDTADFSNGTPLTQAQINDTAVVTNGADRLACQFVSVIDDNAVGPFTGMSGGTWAEAVAEYASSAGNPDGCIQLQTATIAAAGTIDGGSYTMAASDHWGVIGLALIPPSGTTTNQALTATVTTSASMVRSTGKIVSATVTTTASIVRQIAKTVSATVTTTASIVKSVGKPISATVTTTATLTAFRQFLVALTATVTTSASIVKSVGKNLSATVTTTATVVRQIAKTLTATVTTTASVTKSVAKTLSATVTTTASLVADFIPGGAAAVAKLRTLLGQGR